MPPNFMVATNEFELPLQEQPKDTDDTARPEQPCIIGCRAEKFGHVRDHSAGTCELVEAFDGRLSGHLAVEVLPPGDRRNHTDYAEEDEPGTHPSHSIASHLGDLGLLNRIAGPAREKGDGLVADLDRGISPHTSIAVPHGLSARPIAGGGRGHVNGRRWCVVTRSGDGCSNNGPSGEATDHSGGNISAACIDWRWRPAGECQRYRRDCREEKSFHVVTPMPAVSDSNDSANF
jgi:hypothetical protein